MSRRIDIPVRVEVRADGQPKAFTWRGVRFRVLSCNEPWHLQDRWWMTPGEADQNGGKGFSDRWYYRVHAKASGVHFDLICDLYYDRAQRLWVLDTVQD